MTTLEQLKKLGQLKKEQERLDEEIIICPKCGQEIEWGLYKEIGCEKEFIEEMEKKGLKGY